jgi:hydrogenase maturation protease
VTVAAVAIVGVGNEFRGDDAVGILIARGVRGGATPPGLEVLEEHGEPVGIIDRVAACDAVVIVDAMRSGAAPGTVRRFDVTRAALPVALRTRTSTHAVPLADAVELGRALGRLPPRVVVFAVEGCSFGPGAGLSAAVRDAVPAATDAVRAEAAVLARGAGAPRAATHRPRPGRSRGAAG